jgi:hypothetical protein
VGIRARIGRQGTHDRSPVGEAGIRGTPAGSVGAPVPVILVADSDHIVARGSSDTQAAKPLASRSAERARATRSGQLGSVLDLERVRQAVRTVVDNQPLIGILAADLLVDLSGRRGRPRPELDQERVSLGIIQNGLAGHGWNVRSRKALCTVLPSSRGYGSAMLRYSP